MNKKDNETYEQWMERRMIKAVKDMEWWNKYSLVGVFLFTITAFIIGVYTGYFLLPR